MVANAELDQYLAEIRREVCAHCIERPVGGPPCLALGKRCGVELHLAEVVALVHRTNSLCVAPYHQNLHSDICANCANRVTDQCPCALDYLMPLVIEAIETVDYKQAQVAAAL